MKPVICKFGAIADAFAEHGKWFSNHKSLEKQGIIDPGALLAGKFEQMFGRKIEEFDIMSLTAIDAKRFRDELNMVVKAFEKGKIDYTKLGEWLWSTSERAKTAPQMAAVHNDLLNIQHRKKGYDLKGNQLYHRILDSLERESSSKGYHENSILSGSKGGFKKAIKKAMDLERKIEELQTDAYNNKSGAQEALERAIREQTDYLQNHEGRAFYEFIELIEKGLPKLQDQIDARKADLIKQGVVKSKIRAEKISELFTDITDSPFMRRALGDYIELTDFTWKLLDDGVSAYIRSIQHGLEAKGYSSNSGQHRSIEEIGKELKKSLMPDKKVGYFPQYNYKLNVEFLDNLMPHMEKLAVSSRESMIKNETGIDEAIQGVKGYISARAKHRKKTKDFEYSHNFPAVLKKYVDEIARFNYVNFTQEATRRGLLEIKNMYRDGKVVDGYGTDLIQQVLDLNSAQLGEVRLQNPEADALIRAIGNIEYSSKIGGNFRTPAKNAFQRLLEFMYFGRKGLSESKKLYELDPDLLRRVDTMSDEAGFKFEAVAKELQEVAGERSFRSRVKLSGVGEIELTKPSRIEKFADFTGKIAGSKVMSGMMQYTENLNRRGTFRVAFSKMYNDLMNSPGFAEKRAAEGIKGSALNKEIESRAREFGIKMVTMLHFDYSPISKSKAMRSPAGRIILQFQHYFQKMFELSKDVGKDAYRSSVAGKDVKEKISSEEMRRAYRFGFIYFLAPGLLTALTGTSVGNLIEYGPGDKAEQLAAIFTGDDDEIKRSLYGRGYSALLGFPAFADALSYGELLELWNLDEEDWLTMAVGFNDYADATGDQKLMKLVRTINSQAGRLYGQTIPLILQGHPGMALQTELSLYPISKKKRKEQINAIKGKIEAVSPDALENLEELIKQIESQHERATRRTI